MIDQFWKCARCGARERDIGAPLPDGWRTWMTMGGSGADDEILCAPCYAKKLEDAAKRVEAGDRRAHRKVFVEIVETELVGNGGFQPGVIATCSRCEHATESYGTSDRSARRCLALLRKECPRHEGNYYTNDPSVPREDQEVFDDEDLSPPVAQGTMPG